LEGCLSLLAGGLELVQAIKQYREAVRVHDVDGMTIAKQRMVNGLILLTEGVLWLSLGILFLACPQAAIAYSVANLVLIVLQYTLFRGVFAIDSIINLALSVKNLQCTKKHRQLFEEGILKNESLNPTEKEAATRRFLDRFVNVSEGEREKISEKCHRLPSKIDKRMREKLTKKRLIAQRLGINENLLTGKSNAPVLPSVQKCFKKEIVINKVLSGVYFAFIISNIGQIFRCIL
jgi:hypothetical protein